MIVLENRDIGARLDEVAELLAQQGASRFRVAAYRRAADTLRALPEPVRRRYDQGGLEALEQLPGIGPSIARAIRDLLTRRRLPMLDRLRDGHDPTTLLRSVPGVGRSLAWKLQETLGIETLAELEAAAHDGRLQQIGFGAKRLAGIKDSLAHRLGPLPRVAAEAESAARPSVEELLDVDAEYLRGAAAGTLQRIAPRRFNPARKAWLPILHTTRGPRHYTALYSNTSHAHALGRTRDWVVLFYDDSSTEGQCTVITARFGPLEGRRIVRGREAECEAYYARTRIATAPVAPARPCGDEGREPPA
jgi:DNA polymerase (family 10)